MKKNERKKFLVISISIVVLLGILLTVLVCQILTNSVYKKIIPGITYQKVENAYYFETSYADVYIPEYVDEIQIAFGANKNKCVSISVSENNPKYYSKYNCLIEKETNLLVMGCINSIIPKEVTLIDEEAFIGIFDSKNSRLAFSGNANEWIKIISSGSNPIKHFFGLELFNESTKTFNDLEYLELDEDITFIPDYCFYNCDSLKHIKFNNNINTIGAYAFGNCIKLEEIDIKESVKTIKKGAFYNCKSIKRINIPFIGEEQDSQENGYLTYIFGLNKENFNIGDDFRNEIEITITNEISINECALIGFRNISKLTIQGNILSIESTAFEGVYLIENFYFCDTYDKFIKLFNENNIENHKLPNIENFYEFVSGEYRLVKNNN